jgi:hypothetical protein
VLSESDIQDSTTHLIIFAETYREDKLVIRTTGFPKPNLRWRDFPDHSKPKIKGICPIHAVSYEELQEGYGYTTLQVFLSDISPPGIEPWETIYIGVSINTNISDIEHYLLPAIASRLKSTKNGDDFKDWKYYLAIYDLRLQYPSMTYDEIARELREAFPEHKENLDVERCKYYFHLASVLTNGGYKKYLSRSSESPFPSHI